MVSISRSIFPACRTTDIEQPMIRIRLYREGGQYVESANKKGYTEKGSDTWNWPIKNKRKKEKKKKKKKRRHMYNSR
jgi:flagellar hook assembly protein FlgD